MPVVVGMAHLWQNDLIGIMIGVATREMLAINGRATYTTHQRKLEYVFVDYNW
jgi:hypothetical protein